jgi:hypothetical protein
VRDIDWLRIEYKLDLIIQALQTGVMLPAGSMPMSEMNKDPCPVCGEPVKLSLDLPNEQVVRDCGCRPPMAVVPGISALMNNPQIQKKETDDGGREQPEEDGVPPDEAPRGPGQR